MSKFGTAGAVVALVCVLCSAVRAAETDVQIVDVDFSTGVVTLHNFGATDEPLDFWRLCTHDENQTFQYTLFAGLVGQTIEAGTDFFIHYNNDAPADADSINIGSLGAHASPLDGIGAYAIGLYWPNGGSISFSNPVDLADHVQWSEGGVTDPSADARSQVAVDAGIWTAVGDWISTDAMTTGISLDDNTGALLHGPANYTVNGVPADPDPTKTQVTDVDFATGVVTLRNFGTVDQPLDFWRICTHDEDQVFQYTLFAGLVGQTIEAGTEYTVHFNNDAPGGTDSINISSLGAHASPLDGNGAYAIGLYWPNGGSISFGNAEDLADHVQWSTGGITDPIADARSQVAVNAGLWTAVGDWISTDPMSTGISLDDMSGALLHGPANYTVNGPSGPDPRTVQITSVNFENGVVTLTNLGPDDVPLDGFTFCSHDEDEAFRYSFGSALNGFVIEAGTTFHVHYNGDAPGGDPDRVNILDIGGPFSWALPLDPEGAYALSLYFPIVDFDDGNTMADHVQFSDGGIDDAVADERSDEAVAGGLWVAEVDWVDVNPDALRVDLDDLGGNELHGSSDFSVTTRCFGDCAPENPDGTFGNGIVNIDDLLAVINAFGDPGGPCDIAPPRVGNLIVNIDDLLAVINNFGVCIAPGDA
ncbi:MAG: hypothetical protein AAF432_08475 [Planctomycetota bacterium]